jgi:hypothetical protein
MSWEGRYEREQRKKMNNDDYWNWIQKRHNENEPPGAHRPKTKKTQSQLEIDWFLFVMDAQNNAFRASIAKGHKLEAVRRLVCEEVDDGYMVRGKKHELLVKTEDLEYFQIAANERDMFLQKKDGWSLRNRQWAPFKWENVEYGFRRGRPIIWMKEHPQAESVASSEPLPF